MQHAPRVHDEHLLVVFAQRSLLQPRWVVLLGEVDHLEEFGQVQLLQWRRLAVLVLVLVLVLMWWTIIESDLIFLLILLKIKVLKTF